MHCWVQFPKFLLCGMGAAAADFGLYGWLVRSGLNPLFAHLISRPTGGLVGFLGHRGWTFRGRDYAYPWWGQAGRYAVVWIVAYVASSVLLSLHLLWLPHRPTLAKLLSEGTVGLVNFVLQRQWTFAARHPREAGFLPPREQQNVRPRLAGHGEASMGAEAVKGNGDTFRPTRGHAARLR